MQYQDVINKWNISLSSKKSSGTIKNYIPDCDKFFKWYSLNHDMCNIDLNVIKQVTPSDMDMYIYYLTHDCHNQPQTVNRKLSSIRAFYNFLVIGMKLLEENNINSVESLIVRVEKKDYCGTADVRMAVDNLQTRNKIRDRVMVLFGAYTGLRRSEIANAKIHDIDFKLKQIYVIGKGSKERKVDLSDDAILEIQSWLNIRPKVDSDYLFISERGGKMCDGAVYNIFKKNLGDINPKFSTHTTRNTFITTMLENNVTPMLVREEAGHANVATTQRYYLSSPTERQKAVSTIKI